MRTQTLEKSQGHLIVAKVSTGAGKTSKGVWNERQRTLVSSITLERRTNTRRLLELCHEGTRWFGTEGWRNTAYTHKGMKTNETQVREGRQEINTGYKIKHEACRMRPLDAFIPNRVRLRHSQRESQHLKLCLLSFGQCHHLQTKQDLLFSQPSCKHFLVLFVTDHFSPPTPPRFFTSLSHSL